MLSRQRSWRAVRLWLIADVAICAITSVLEVAPSMKGVAAFISASAFICVIQVVAAAWLIWKMGSHRRLAYMLVGGGAGFLIPLILILVIGPLSRISDFFVVVLWALLGCLVPLLGCGLIGGAWVGYIRHEDQTGTAKCLPPPAQRTNQW